MKPLWCFVSPSGPVPSRISRVPEATKSARHCGVFRYFYQTTDTNSFLLNLFIISDSWTLAYVSAHVSRPCASKEWGMKGEQRIEKGRICYTYAESLFYFIEEYKTQTNIRYQGLSLVE